MIVLAVFLLVLITVEAVFLIRLRGQGDTYKEYWLARAQEEMPPNGLLYVALGDSTAQGIGASKPQNGYVGLLAERLSQQSGRPVYVINLSVSGGRVQDVVDKQLPALKALDLPKDAVVTLAVGANNVRTFERQSFKSSMEQLIAQLPPQTVVADTPYFGGGRHNTYEQKALEASVIIRELTAQQGLRLAPLHEVTRVNDSWRSYAADWFHPSDYAYRHWADAFWQVLEPQTPPLAHFGRKPPSPMPACRQAHRTDLYTCASVARLASQTALKGDGCEV